MAQSFRAKKSSQRVIEFELADDMYYFKSGKSSEAFLGMMMAPEGNFRMIDITKSQLNWFTAGLDPLHNDSHEPKQYVEGCQACRVTKRMLDPNDEDVDLDVVLEIVQWLMGQVTARPTGSPSA